MAAVAHVVAGDAHFAQTPARAPAPRSGAITVLITDLHSAALLHVRALLAGAHEVTIIAEATPTHSAALATRLGPDVIITEITEWDARCMTAIRTLAAATARARVLVVSARPEPEWLLEALEAGAAGAISARATRDEALIALRAIVNGQIVLHRTALGALTAREPHARAGSSASDSRQRLACLTAREQSVFRMIAEGYSAPEVGARLLISKKTVETYKKRIGQKLGFSHRSDYVRLALQANVLAAREA